MSALDTYFDQFVRERTYLNNVTPKTREWYQTAWKAFTRFQADAPPRTTTAPIITRADLQQFVVHLRERGIKPVSCNCWLRAMNAFCGWLHQRGVISEPLRLRPQKLEKRILRLHDTAELRNCWRFDRLRSSSGEFTPWPAQSSIRGAASTNSSPCPPRIATWTICCSR